MGLDHWIVADTKTDKNVPIIDWRKANHIHNWFVNNVQDGVDDQNSYVVTREKLELFVELCESVIASPASAKEVLPTASGYFFGSTDYDEWYFEDLKDTVAVLKQALEDEDYITFYYGCWW